MSTIEKGTSISILSGSLSGVRNSTISTPSSSMRSSTRNRSRNIHLVTSASQHTSSIILDFGTAYLRVGIAGESKPRHVLQTSSKLFSVPYHYNDDNNKSNDDDDGDNDDEKVATIGRSMSTASFTPKSEEEWTRMLHPLLEDLYTKYLLVKPKSRRVIVLMPTIFYNPFLDHSKNNNVSNFQKALQSILIQHLAVPNLLIVNSGSFRTILPYALGGLTQTMGVILDIGRLEGRVAFVYNGTCLMETLNVVPCGFESLARTVMDYYNDWISNTSNTEDGDGNHPEQTLVTNVQDGYAIVQTFLEQNNDGQDIDDDDDDDDFFHTCYLPHTQRIIRIPTVILESSIQDLYFNPSNPSSLLSAFFLSLLSCPLDLRKLMVRNLIFVGGTVLGLSKLKKTDGSDSGGTTLSFEERFVHSISSCFEIIDPNDNNNDINNDNDDKENVQKYKVTKSEYAKFQSIAPIVMDAPLSITYPLPITPTSIAWVGGSIMGSLDLSKENWIKE